MAGGSKPNPMLEKLEAKIRLEEQAKARAQFNTNSEIDLIAHIISCADDFNIGPGRAERCLCGYLETKMDIAKMITDAVDVDDDDEFLLPKRDIAWKLKNTLGPVLWEKYKGFFPMVQEYW